MKLILNALIFTLCTISFGYSQNYKKEIKEFQKELNEEISREEKPILLEEDRKDFEGLEFYPINENYKVTAKLVLIYDKTPIGFATTTDRISYQTRYAEAHFTLNGKPQVLYLYESVMPIEEEGYENYLFLPFTDATNGNGSYGGGRFIDLFIPEKGDEIVIDFNKAYNPYCAYSPNFSCPIPPAENRLDVAVEAGVKEFKAH